MMRVLFGVLAILGSLGAQVPAGDKPASNRLWIRDPLALNAPWQPIGRAQRLVSIAAWNGRLYAASSTGYLLVREPDPRDVPWTIIGHAQEVTSMTALDGNLYAACLRGTIWVRPPVHKDIVWKQIGNAPGIIAMAALNGNIYAANTQGRLLVWVAAAHTPVRWLDIGPAERATALAAMDRKLYAATSDNRLLVRDAVEQDRSWMLIGHTQYVTAMTAFNGRLFAAAFTPEVNIIPAKGSLCDLWTTNQVYAEARALIRAAREAGTFQTRQQCLEAADDPKTLKRLLGQRELADVIAGTCTRCACTAEF